VAAGLLAAVIALVVVVVASRSAPATTTTTAVAVGNPAPEGTFTTSSGATRTISSLHGTPSLVWFVSTWCSSCQAGTQAMASEIATFSKLHVRVVELELADDLGQPGPSITTFANQLAGRAVANPDWTFGVASSALSTTYDPAADLDIYYLINSAGNITYINSAPGSTMSQLLAQAARLT
jgi:thiol-disulfide isomerase/thioredoxin